MASELYTFIENKEVGEMKTYRELRKSSFCLHL